MRLGAADCGEHRQAAGAVAKNLIRASSPNVIWLVEGHDPEVKVDLNRRAEAHDPLPTLVVNGYDLLGYDWRETAKDWSKAGAKTPPVMITVANRTETAARIKYAFDHKKIHIHELTDDPERTLQIDSKVLEEAESTEEPVELQDTGEISNEEEGDEEPTHKLTKKQQAELLRLKVDTVGQTGKPGEQIQNVISVGMLSEGWDAKTVTHIMGLRAFTSQLLCEQVVGRGLRRTAYETDRQTGLFDAEYVNIFGVPFTFLPHESTEGTIPAPPKPKTTIEPDPAKIKFQIRWPNVLRVDHTYRPNLSVDWDKVDALELKASQTAKLAELAPILDGKPDVTEIAEIDLEGLAREFRTQKIIFETARDVYEQMQKDWKGNRESLIAQLIRIVEDFIRSKKIGITPTLFNQDDLKRRLIITLNMSKVVQHVSQAIRFENAESLELVFDRDRPISSTADMMTWYTGKPVERAKRSHINFCVLDSAWEASEAFELDRNPHVEAWVKNDHLGFEVLYIYRGVVRRYRPDFIVRFTSGEHLILETKGKDSEQDQTKRRYLDEWTKAVNQYGGFGLWSWDVSKDPADVADILVRHASRQAALIR
jgi:type III restriction enzyme